jgi:phosphoribosyl-AMP cyclohydrolase
MNGKGSNARPLSVSQEEYARRWAIAFGSQEALDEAVANADAHYWAKKAEQEQAEASGE